MTREIPRAEPVFFYADTCPLCAPTLATVLPIFEAADTRLIIRKPTTAELATPGFKFPALLVPKGVLGFNSTVLMVGRAMAHQIAILREEAKKEARPAHQAQT